MYTYNIVLLFRGRNNIFFAVRVVTSSLAWLSPCFSKSRKWSQAGVILTQFTYCSSNVKCTVASGSPYFLCLYVHGVMSSTMFSLQ